MEMSNFEKEQAKQLLPCPCCNSRVDYYQPHHHMKHFINKNIIICHNCGLQMEHASGITLFRNWNNRRPIDIVLEQIKKEEECSQKGLDNAITKSIKDTKYGEVRGYNTSYNILELCTKKINYINSEYYQLVLDEMEIKK